MIFNCNISEIVHESSTTVILKLLIMIFLTDDNISLNCGYSNPNFVDVLDIASSSDIFVYISLFEVQKRKLPYLQVNNNCFISIQI